MSQYHCVDCFQRIAVQDAHEIYLHDEGMRDGHYFAVYGYGAKLFYCRDCRHRMTGFVRLVRMQQAAGYDVAWYQGSPPLAMSDEERFAIHEEEKAAQS